ncbi:MAG TPA: dihydroorotase [Planctomycetaceae bacterium]|nr:dihydroorotase [Planctomycetaceae bacterium]
MSLFIQNGRLIDPSQNLDRIGSLRTDGVKIVSYDGSPQSGDEIIDAAGRIVSPGFVDMHVHLREPGKEEDETIDTGTQAAIFGGFTTIVCCPNTTPPIDSQAMVEFVRQKAMRADRCNVYAICCISKGREGKELAELGQLFEAGAIACSDDGAPVEDAELTRRAFEYCRMFDKPLLSHPEVTSLTKGGVMHEGAVSLQLGLRGMPAAAEDVMIVQDITLAELTGGRLHVMHVSTGGAVQAIRRAKERGVRVTAEITPHHLTLTDESLRSFDSHFKMSPPLRSRDHLEACIEGLRDGTIDAIATDHAPHAAEKKMQELDRAPFGIIGLETALGVVGIKLIEPGLLDWPTLIAKMSTNPARILGIPKGTLQIGADADITLIDPEKRWTVTKESFRGKSKNSPYLGWELRGKAETVIVRGRIIKS